MKPQDILFLFVFAFLLYRRSPILPAGLGLVLLIVSAPLFMLWIFFTAQRLVMYASALFLLSVCLHVYEMKKAERAKGKA